MKEIRRKKIIKVEQMWRKVIARKKCEVYGTMGESRNI
jgi:hypothetical protein